VGEVAGAETVVGGEEMQPEGGAPGEEGQVLGEETEKTAKSFTARTWPWILGLIILALMYYGFIRKKEKGNGSSNVKDVE
jgi:hypothetical protein